MAGRLRVLMVEDSAADATLLERHLSRAGYEIISARVHTAEQMKAALESAAWDVILCDYVLPRFNALAALEVLKEHGSDTPLIIVAGAIGDELAVEAMVAGAQDYLMKDNLARLAPAIDREVNEAENRRARRRAENALAESEDRYRDLVENSQDLICTHDLEGRILSFNQAAEKLMGYDRKEILGRNIRDLLLPRYRSEFEAYLAEIRRKGIARGLLAVPIRSGEKRIWEYTNTLRTEGVPIPIVRGMAHDVTERRRAERALQQSQERLQALFDNTQDAIFLADESGRYVDANPAASMITGYSRDEIVGKKVGDFGPPRLRERGRQLLQEVVRMGRLTGEYTVVRKDGTEIETEFRAVANFQPGLHLSVIRDITEPKRVERALQRSEERFRALIENNADIIAIIDAAGKVLYVSPSVLRMLGYAAEEWVGQNVFGFIHPDDALAAAEALQAGLDHVDAGLPLELRVRHHNGTWRVLEAADTNLLDNEAVAGIVINARDITERKALEEQLRQAQKMEAIGQLAGGIAHDFNNLLTAITGYSEITMLGLMPEDPMWGNINEISKAADRAASLTRQLLAFSRKQVLQPKVLDLNAVILGMEEMLRRLIGEHIELRTVLAPELGSTRADPGQIEQVIMNLAVNSHDAMPHGGKLTLETANVDLGLEYSRQHLSVGPGPYVMIAVSDTGTGMDSQILPRIFEPFFTTKGPGKGTGLGLSTVYGIVKQSGGDILVYSEIDRGTAFKIYLPRTQEINEVIASIPPQINVPRGSETVLLVEDEALVRKLVREVLQGNGYTVLEASTDSEALRIAHDPQYQINLLLTDVVMPGTSGGALANRIGMVRPDIAVLYMSGYTDNALADHGVLAPGIAFLQKPFTPDTLIRKVREVLNGASKTPDSKPADQATDANP